MYCSVFAFPMTLGGRGLKRTLSFFRKFDGWNVSLNFMRQNILVIIMRLEWPFPLGVRGEKLYYGSKWGTDIVGEKLC